MNWINNLKFYILILLCLSNFIVFAQNDTDNWYFGKNAGLSFTNGVVNVYSNGGMITPAGCTSISDANGNLMFYTNGNTIWNRNHQIMDNGENLSAEVEGIQTSIIIPKPNDPSTYYVFYTRENNVNTPMAMMSGIYFSEVKFTALNPLGIVTLKNERISNTATSRLAAVYHYETNTYKLIGITKPNIPIVVDGQELLVFKIFEIGINGVDLNPTIVTINEPVGTIGAMKISPNGEHLAIANFENMKLFTYHFDSSTNSISHYKTIPSVPALGLFLNPYGIEFSQDSKMLYYTGFAGQATYIVQIQYSELDNPFDIPDYYFFEEPKAKSLQLARNGKIYVAKGEINTPYSRISVINNPEKQGVECSFQSNAIQLSPASSTEGLPIFVASSLRNRILVSDDTCINSPFTFNLDLHSPLISVEWDFGDGTTTTNSTPSHSFSTFGIKNIKATVVTTNSTFILYKSVEVFPPAIISPGRILTQCDNDNDGSSIFNLKNISDFISNANSEFEYYFYNSLEDAQNNENQIQNPINYTNRFDFEEIFVKIITEKGCPLISSFFIENVSTAPSAPLPSFYACENSDNVINNSEGAFDLEAIKSNLITILNTPPNYQIKFYPSYLDAQTKLNEIAGTYTSETSVIWIRLEDENNSCNGIFSFTIEVNDEIEINIEEKYTICDTNVQEPIVLDGGNSNTSWTWRNISLQVLSTDRFFPLVEEGKFSVILEKEQNGLICSETIYFDVDTVITPTLEEIRIDNNTIFISVRGSGDYEFSLDNITYTGFGKTHTFSDLQPGIYTVYIRDVNGCSYAIQEEVLIVKFPEYFSPNGDGINDYWKLYGPISNYYSSIEVMLFDRFGNLLHAMNLDTNNQGWDGTINGKKLPSTDYWYVITFKDFNSNVIVKKGHFSLIR